VNDLLGRAARYAARRLTRFADQGLTVQAPTTHVHETTPVIPRASLFKKRRLNLLVPSINSQHYFGGIHTAMQMFEAMATHFDASRIVLTDSVPDDAALARFGRYLAVTSEQDSAADAQVVSFSDRYGKTLPVGANDHWLATAWWTAYAAQRITSWQQEACDAAAKLAYIIQDFEPGFYPWSSQSALALATYRPKQDLGIFNTSLLADYFASQGLDYARKVVFEPTINDGLRAALAQAGASTTPRVRRIVVYGRPSTPRNAFPLICEALRIWGWSDSRGGQWEIVAPGELTADIDLGPVRLKALGKLDIDKYAELLRTSAIGLSLMVSPHPSYPPLEMAAFGMEVITNRYANKDLSTFAPVIRSTFDMTPESIAKSLSAACDAWDKRLMMPVWVMPQNHAFLAKQAFESLAAAAVHHLAAGA
jgi:O-antigen biosynthesis protein